MLSFLIEEAMKYRMRELYDEAIRARPYKAQVVSDVEARKPKTVQFRGRWIPLDELQQEAGRL